MHARFKCKTIKILEENLHDLWLDGEPLDMTPKPSSIKQTKID